MTLAIYNLQGQQIRTFVQNQTEQAGTHLVQWDARDDFGQEVATGVYFYKLTCGDFVDVKKMILMR